MMNLGRPLKTYLTSIVCNLPFGFLWAYRHSGFWGGVGLMLIGCMLGIVVNALLWEDEFERWKKGTEATATDADTRADQR